MEVHIRICTGIVTYQICDQNLLKFAMAVKIKV